MIRSYLAQHAVVLYEPFIGTLLQSLRQEVCTLTQELASTALPMGSDEAQKGFSLLDCCCGAGGFLGYMQAHNAAIVKKGPCLGLDISSAMLRQATKHVSQASFIQGTALKLPFATQSIYLATVCMALHTMPSAQGQKLFQELLRVARYVIVADYSLPERNISFPSVWLAHGVEWLVGGEHYTCYKEFMRLGALEGFCHMHGLSVVTRRMTLGGAGLVVLLDSVQSTS